LAKRCFSQINFIHKFEFHSTKYRLPDFTKLNLFQRYHALCFIHVMSAKKLVLDRLRLEIVFLSKKYFFYFLFKTFFLKKKEFKKTK